MKTSTLPRTLSGDLGQLKRSMSTPDESPLPPPPPSYPAPIAPDDDRMSLNSSSFGVESSFRPGMFHKHAHGLQCSADTICSITLTNFCGYFSSHALQLESNMYSLECSFHLV